jgi:hypothetical protein
MLRRSLFLLLAFALAVLGVTAVYALLRLRGTEDMIEDAIALLPTDPAATARMLDQCEPKGGLREPDLRRQFFRLRYEANKRLQNHARALKDLENLIDDGDPDPALQLDRIYRLALLGRGAPAKQRALEFLAKHPDSARGLELAGEASQVEYRDQLTKTSEQLRTDLEYDLHDAAIEAMLAFLYRPDTDVGGRTALADLRALYERDPRRRQAWSNMQAVLLDLRQRIQQALGYYQRALEQATRGPVDKKLFFAAAFRAVSFALQQGGRLDDVVAQAEVYRDLYDNEFTVEAAIAAAHAHLQDGYWRAAVDAADRYLPPGTFKARDASNRINPTALQPLMEAKALALYRLGAHAELEKFERELREMDDAKIAMPRPLMICGAFARLTGDTRTDDQALRGAEAMLAVACNLSLSKPQPVTGPDVFEIVEPLRIQLMQQLGMKPASMLEDCDLWQRHRPGSLGPARARSRVLLAAGQAAAAMTTANEVLQKDPRDEETLRLLAAAARLAYAEAGQDGDGLLLQCLSRGLQRPEVPHPVCYLLCGEVALAQQRLNIARECGRAACDQFPQARWPRHLYAQALLAGGAFHEAEVELESTFAVDADDRESLALWFTSRRKLEQRPGPHLADVVRTGVDDAAVDAELLANALPDNPTAAWFVARKVARRAATDDAMTPELLALAARALAPVAPAEARALLDRARDRLPRFGPAATIAVVDATLAWIQALATTTADEPLAAQTLAELRHLEILPGNARALLDAGAALEPKHPHTAWELVGTALALRDAAEQRDGPSFLLAARLLLRLGRLEPAAEHLTAALSFPDGEAAAEPLARLLLLRGQPDRAAEAFALATAPTDAALALRCGQREAAFLLAQKAVVADPSDLLGQVVFALTSQLAPGAFGVELKSADADLVTATAELASLLADDQLAGRALPRATALAAKLPESAAAQLLLARAQLAAGHAAEAQAIHARLFSAGTRPLQLYGEAVRAAHEPGYTMSAAMHADLRRVALSSGPTAPLAKVPPALYVFAIEDLALEAAAAGHPEAAAQFFTDLWLRFPVQSGATVAKATAIAAQGRMREALVVLDALRRTGPASQQQTAATAMFLLATDGPLDAGSEAALVTAARAQMKSDGPTAPALRFLLAEPRRLQGVADDDLRDWLEALILRAAGGGENMPFAVETLQTLERRAGREAALAVVDKALHAHPETLHFWVARAHLLAQARRAAEGIADARHALAHGDAPQLELELLALAGEERCLADDDFARIPQVPKELLDTPLGKYVRGLAALRLARFDEAGPLLAAAPPRPSGFPLYARALAELPRKGSAGLKAAAALFAQFAAGYPSSAFARSAGSFALQLGPN